jgi:hypothetical protein
MPLPVNAVKGGDIFHEGCSGGLNEFPKKISALNYLRTLSTGKDQSLKEREKIGPLFIQLDEWIRLPAIFHDFLLQAGQISMKGFAK